MATSRTKAAYVPDLGVFSNMWNPGGYPNTVPRSDLTAKGAQKKTGTGSLRPKVATKGGGSKTQGLNPEPSTITVAK